MGLTAKAQTVHNLLQGKAGITRIEGQSIRPIAGTNTPSEHSYGNALDVYGTPEALAYWADYFHKTRGEWDIKVVCYDPGIGRKYDHCTTKHTTHLHIDFGPHCGGTVSASGSADELVTRCNTYQGGGTVAPGGASTGLLGGILQPITDLFNRAAIITVGAVIGVVAVVLIVKDTAAGKAAIGAVTSAATGGAGRVAKAAKGLKGTT